MTLSESKIFALEVLDILDELVKPEIKNRFLKSIWYGAEWLKFGGVYNWVKEILIKKPDEEINAKLLLVRKKLNSKFNRLDSSVEINVAEKMGAIKIPMVGELAKVKKLTTINIEQAEQLEKELFRI